MWTWLGPVVPRRLAETRTGEEVRSRGDVVGLKDYPIKLVAEKPRSGSRPAKYSLSVALSSAGAHASASAVNCRSAVGAASSVTVGPYTMNT